jgi:hypothetical protein
MWLEPLVQFEKKWQEWTSLFLDCRGKQSLRLTGFFESNLKEVDENTFHFKFLKVFVMKGCQNISCSLLKAACLAQTVDFPLRYSS